MVRFYRPEKHLVMHLTLQGGSVRNPSSSVFPHLSNPRCGWARWALLMHFLDLCRVCIWLVLMGMVQKGKAKPQ